MPFAALDGSDLSLCVFPSCVDCGQGVDRWLEATLERIQGRFESAGGLALDTRELRAKFQAHLIDGYMIPLPSLPPSPDAPSPPHVMSCSTLYS